MGKKLFRSFWVQSILSLFLAGYLWLVKHTTRWQVEGQDIVDPVWADKKGVVVALWHSRVLMTIAAWPMDKSPQKQMPSFLISLSPDGAFITKATRLLGAQVIRGSAVNPKKPKKNKRGLVSFREMKIHIAAGGCMALTPDGPRGPRAKAHMGAISLAAQTGAPILCLGWSTTHAWFSKSWDRLCLPLPFGRGTIVWKGPIWVPQDADHAMMEARRLQMEVLISEATLQADQACGHEAIPK